MAQRSPAMSRRERRRLETYDEIVEVSRALLRQGDTLSLRAVAAQMGMTAPALYRYIDSVDELHVLVARDICTDVVAAMDRARDFYPRDDPAARLAASATMLRCWALANRIEFQMAFANRTLAAASCPTRRKELGLLHEVDDDSPNPFAAHFAGLFIELHSQGLIAVPTPADLDPGLHALVQESAGKHGDPFVTALGVEGLGTLWLFKLAWARLYGVLMVEVFGQVEAELIGSDAVFNTLMRETFASLGLADSWDRLIAVSRDTALRAGAERPAGR
jgi:AcrR family transcriptional regulator